MKRKLALLLAVVMVFSTLPMNVFGTRPGSVRNPQATPVWDVAGRGGAVPLAFRVDAETLSGLDFSGGRVAGLEFVMSGGANASIAGFANPTDAQVDAGLAADPQRITTAAAIRFLPGTNFRVGADDAGAEARTIAFLEAINDGATVSSATVAGVPSGARTAQNAITFSDHDTPPASGWNVTDGEPNFPANYAHTRFSRQMHVNLYTAFAGAISSELPQLHGWLDIEIYGMRAFNPEAEMSIELVRGGGGELTRRTTLLAAGSIVAGDWGGGVTVSAVSVIPMRGVSALSGIRITENAVGRLLPEDPGTNSNVLFVRLVAPRGFRWETGDIQGYTAPPRRPNGGIGAQGNVAFADRDTDGWFNGTSPVGPVTGNAALNNLGGNPFMNENTSRNELFLQIDAGLTRGTSVAARTARAEITIHGLALIPVRGAATSGNIAVDVYVGNAIAGDNSAPNGTGIGLFGQRPYSPTTALNARDERAAGSWWTERTAYAHNWRETINVGTFDFEGDLDVTGPAELTDVRSGDWTDAWERGLGDRGRRSTPLTAALTGSAYQQGRSYAFPAFDNDSRWLNGEYHSLRITEVVPGAMFRSLDRYEIVPANEGVRIVDARVRAGRGTATDTRANLSGNDWQNFLYQDVFLPALTDFNYGEYLSFATRPQNPESQSRVRHLEIGFLLSIEAGFEAKHGDEVDLRVYRNGQYVGSATVANAYDPIRLESGAPEQITRNALDVLALTPVAPFTLEETEPGAIGANDHLYFRLQATQNGREVTIPMGNMTLWLTNPEVNTEDSGFELVSLAGDDFGFRGDGIGFRVRSSSHGTAGSARFEEVYVAGPTVPGLEWHVVAFSPSLSPNSHLIMGDTDYVDGLPRGNATQELTSYELRGRFYQMPYSTIVLDVGGVAVIDVDGPVGNIGPGIVRTPFVVGRTAIVDGVAIPEVIFAPLTAQVGSFFMNPRVFADFVGGSVTFDEGTGAATFTGTSARGEQVTVTLTLNSTNAIVNGQTVDIATGAGQAVIAGTLAPLNLEGRMFVPARFLAQEFGLVVDFVGNHTLILG